MKNTADTKKIKALVIAGPTASGKTSAAIQLAHRFDGEIISADSMQIYRYMDIGTAKPDMEEREGVPHHMIDIVNPWENYSVAGYVSAARKCIRDTAGRGRLPIIAGGTGLYINAIVENINYDSAPDIPREISDELEEYARINGAEALHGLLQKEDPEAAEQIHFNNIKRVIRAIGMKKVSGMTLSQRNTASRSEPGDIECDVYAIDTERSALYERINARVDKMMNAGLENEVRNVIKLCENAYNDFCTNPEQKQAAICQKGMSATALQAIGYKEIISYLSGEYDLETAIERIKQNSRNYAKRQITWFKKPDWVKWIRLDELMCIKNPRE